MDIAERGRRHLADALAQPMKHCEVSEWLDDDGKPLRIYWRPLTGAQQLAIEQGQSDVDRICLTLKQRALDADGRPIFQNTPLESLKQDYDFSVLRSIAFLMSMEIGEQMDAEVIEKE